MSKGFSFYPQTLIGQPLHGLEPEGPVKMLVGGILQQD